MSPPAASMLLLCLLTLAVSAPAQETSDVLTDRQVTDLARLALKGISQEYPNKPANVMDSADDVRSPREMHPVFYGSFDWHSSVHGHWMLARLLRLYPDSSIASDIRDALNQQLTAANIRAEAEYFQQPHNTSFERMYGWAWLLQLARELQSWDDPDANNWRENLRPLETEIRRRAVHYLPKLTFPIRVGTHTDTAFALSMELDYARAVGDAEFEKLLAARARSFYGRDRDYPAHYEPSGHDFFSPGFNEADLMRRVLPAGQFRNWLDNFLPQLKQSTMGPMIKPVQVSDVSDGHLVHLAGLDLSRAWTMQGIAQALPKSDPRRNTLLSAVSEHTKIGLSYVTSGHYEGEHWLATFAVYHLTGSGQEVPAQ